MINTKKVAEIAGVSRSTVQRALTGNPNVKKTTREKVQKVAESLGYKPNKTAKALVMRQRKLKYGVIFTSSDNPFYQEEFRGINHAREELNEYGIDIEVEFMDRIDPKEQARLIDRMVAANVKGIAMVALDSDEVKTSVRNGIEKGVQFITITSDVEDTERLCYVGWDHYRGGQVAGRLMKWMVGPGERAVVILGSKKYRAHRKRLEGFTDTFCEGNSANEIIAVLENDDDSEHSKLLINDLFTKPQNVRGLFLGGAGVEGACSALKKLEIDQNIKVLCFDKVASHIQYCREGIIDVVIDQEPFEQGYRAMKILNSYVMFNEIPEKKILSRIDIRIKENIDL
jgi:LacI family transcriptional regulator